MSRSTISKLGHRLSRIFVSLTDFEREYKLGKELGKGAFSTVRLAVEEKTKTEVAVKIVIRKKMTKDDEKALKIEVQILQDLKGQVGVVNLVAYFEEPKQHYIVLECMSGGELFTRIVQREHYSEADAVEVVKTIASVLEYCHSQGIAHRDLKPENVLLKDSTETAQIKLADFGFARYVREGCVTACGTPGYVAPEIITGKVYNAQCDIWSLGVMMFILLCGYPPFYAKNRQDLFKSIRHAKFTFDSPYWDNVSDKAKDLISKMLVVDAHTRLTATQVLDHPWIVDPSASTELNKKALKIFNARRHLRSAFKGAIAAGRIHDLVDDFKLVKAQKKKQAQEA